MGKKKPQQNNIIFCLYMVKCYLKIIVRVGKGGDPYVNRCLACPDYSALSQAESSS